MKRISALIMGLLMTGVFILPAWAGSLTTNKFFYKPSPGARGDTEKQTFDAGLDRIDARLGKEIWVGDPNYGATLQDAITAIGTTNKTILRIPAGAWAITADLTIPANITVKLERGATFSLADTKTLTINGSIDAGPYQIFSWTGTGKVKFLSSSPQVNIYPEWWGAVGDSTTDDLSAFNAAVACAKDSYRGNIILSRMYKLSSTLSIYTSYYTQLSIIGLDKKRTGFYSEAYNYPAIEAISCWNLKLANFTINGSGTANKIPQVAILTARGTGWNGNSENFFDRLYISGSYQYGQIADLNGSTNKYHHIETYTTQPSTDNHWTFCVLFHGKASSDYSVPFGLQSKNITILTGPTAQSSDACSFTDSALQNYGAVPADSAAFYIQSSWVIIDKVYGGGVAGASADIVKIVNGGSSSFNDLSMESTHRYTFNISSTAASSTCACMYAQGIKSSSIPTQALITDSNTELKGCNFDLTGISGGNVLLDGGASTCEFKLGRTATSFVVPDSKHCLGNIIRLGAMTTNLSLPGIGYSRNNIITDLRAFAGQGGYQTLIDGDVRIGQPSFVTPNVLTLNTYKMTWAAAAPTTGSWAQGSVIWKIGAAAGTSPGWYCRLDNTFGTLNSGATTGTIATGTKLLTVNSVTGLTIGNFIDVVADGGGNAVTAGRIVNIDATNKIVTLAANASGTATGTAVSFHNHTTAEAFEAMPSTLARTSGVTGAIATGTAVTHGLGTTPTKVLLTSVDGVPTGIYPNNFGATTFGINFAGGGSHAFYWEAIQ